MTALPRGLAETDRRWVTRVAPDPYLRFDICDYSLDPDLVGRRVEVRVGDREITAVALDTGELACRHARSFARIGRSPRSSTHGRSSIAATAASIRTRRRRSRLDPWPSTTP